MKRALFILLGLGTIAGIAYAAPLTKSVTYNPNLSSYLASVGGATTLSVDFARTSDGKSIGSRQIIVPVSGPVMDGNGSQVAANVPAAFTNARNAYEAQVNALLDAAAAAGKLDP